jgi:hypothetical protein
MKRNPKPFSVEIKKSRVQGQNHHLPPRRLFELTPAKATPISQEAEPQAVAKPLAPPRILPSIFERVRSNSESVEPDHHMSSKRLESDLGQMDSNLRATISEGAMDALAETPVMLGVVSQTDASPVEKAAPPALEVEAQKTNHAKAKPRNKASKIIAPVTAPEPVLQPQAAPETQVTKPPPVNRSRQADPCRLAAAAQLPRHERWKRRLHTAAW